MILKDPVKEQYIGEQGQSCTASKSKQVGDSKLQSEKDSHPVIVLQPGSVLRIEQPKDVKQ